MKTENHYTETDLGNISLNPRGEYDPEAFYEYLDTVSFDGGSYMCLAELGTKITGIPPVPGTNTEHWQILTLPGGLTPEYITMHDEVVEKSKQVEVSRAAVELSQSEIEAMQADVAQLHKDTQDSAQSALASKNQAAGYASAADTSRQAAERAKQDVDAQIPNIDAKLQAALNEIDTTRQSANTAVKKQEELSVQAVKDQTGEYITEQKNLAKQELDQKVDSFNLDVNAIKKQVSDEGAKQVEAVQTAQTTAMKAVETAKSEAVQAVKTEGAAQTGNVSAEGEKQVQAVQTAAQEIIADREQIAQNKADVTTLKEDIKNMDCIIFNDLIHKLSFKPEGTSNNISLEENTIISDGAIASQYKAFVNETLFENNKKYRIVAKFKNTDSKILRIYLNEFTYSYGVSFGHAPGINPKETYTSIVDYDCASTDVRGFSIYCLEESASYAVDIYVYDITDCKYCNNFDFLKGGKTIKILKKDLEKPFFGKVALTYGDSITEQATWQGYLKNELGFTKIINKGVGGRRLIEMATDKALATITEDFDIMLVMGGTNDWAQDRKIGNPTDELTDEVGGFDSTLYGGLNTLIKKLTTKYLDKRIVFITQIPTKHSSGEAFFLKGGSADGVKNSNGDTTADFANATIVACKNNHVPYIDLNCLVGWNKNNIAVYIKNENNAFFHPNDIGGKRIAECISGCLSQIKFI